MTYSTYLSHKYNSLAKKLIQYKGLKTGSHNIAKFEEEEKKIDGHKFFLLLFISGIKE